MSNPSVVIYQLAAAVSNGIALSQAVAGAGNLTLAGSLVTSGVATLDSGGAARRVVMASSGNDATVVFTITGTSRSGVVQTDTITGLNGATTGFSTLDFATVTRISSSAATVGNITAGTNSIGSSPWVVDNFLCAFWLLSGGISGPASVTTYSLEYTYDDPNKLPPTLTVNPQQWSMEAASYSPPLAWPYTGIVSVSGNNEFSFATKIIFAHRLTITAGTGLVVMQSIQAGIHSGW